jgi:hypothetical protein
MSMYNVMTASFGCRIIQHIEECAFLYYDLYGTESIPPVVSCRIVFFSISNLLHFLVEDITKLIIIVAHCH